MIDLENRYMPVPESGCWLWMGPINHQGYGMFNFNGKGHRAHRVSYEQVKGPIPKGLVIDHLCRVTACINPAHLEAVTNKENTLRGISPIAKNAKKTHCLKGHLLIPGGGRGTRWCPICDKDCKARSWDEYYKRRIQNRPRQDWVLATPMERVLSIYPQAWRSLTDGIWTVWSDETKKTILGRAKSPKIAWSLAFESLGGR